jgi:hypothetical protein
MTIQDIISSNSDATSEFKNRITKKNIEREISLRFEDFKRYFFESIERTAKNISNGSIAISWREEKEGNTISDELKSQLLVSLKEVSYKRLQEFDQYIKDIFEIKEQKSSVETPSDPTGDSDNGEEVSPSVNTTKDYFNY